MSVDLYDVVIVGGGPMGLCAAWQCVKRGKKVLVIEQFKFGNEFASSPGFSRQFRTCYSELHLCELAVKTSPLWSELEKALNLDDSSLLDRTGCLWFGDSSVTTSEGNIEKAIENLRILGQDYEDFQTKEEISERFPFIAGALVDVECPRALYLDYDGGTINVPELIKGFVKALTLTQMCDLVEEARVNTVDYSAETEVVVSTDKNQQYRSKKVILTPGAYVNHVLSMLNPLFNQRINLTVYLWSSTYFQIKGLPDPNISKWPIWYFFGEQKSTDDSKPIDYNSYYGFPSDKNDQPLHARVAPAFTSEKKYDFELYPPEDHQREVDEAAMSFTSNFVQKSMVDLECTLIDDKKSTCIAGFAEMADETEDESAGFVLDFVPNTNKRIVLFTGGWGMKYVPIIGEILADLAIDGETEYSSDIEKMNIMRGILIPAEESKKFHGRLAKLTSLQRSAKFAKIWS